MNGRGRGGGTLLAIGTAILVPVVGILLLNFYLRGPSPEELELARAFSPTIATGADAAPRAVPISTRELAATPTFTPQPTPQPSPPPTVTPGPTETPRATAIPTPEPTDTIPPPRDVSPGLAATVSASDGLNVRGGTSLEFDVVRVLRFEEEVVLTGNSFLDGDLQWVELEGEGWVQARYLTFSDQ